MEEPTKTTNLTSPQKISAYIKEKTVEFGFDDCGICKADKMTSDFLFFDNWIKQKFHADMAYLEKYSDKRKDSSQIADGTKSLIIVLKNYFTKDKLNTDKFSISKYAYGKDYHRVIKSGLKQVLCETQKVFPELEGNFFVDTAPIFERSNAVKAGLGFIGKNKCLINKKIGSFTFIGVIALNKELEYDKPEFGDCGDCSLCIDACPTQAITSQGLDANKCISYHTIENKNNIPEKIKKAITTQIFGCDICQDVCPYNKNINEHNDHSLKISDKVKQISIDRLSNLSDSEFKKEFKDSVLLRAGRNKLLNNMKIIFP